jgi:hypothetical protein
LNERHDVEQDVADGSGIVEREDVRMMQVRRDLDLAQESLGADTRRELRAEHFRCDLAVMPDVSREIDGRHPSLAELSLDEVAIA